MSRLYNIHCVEFNSSNRTSNCKKEKKRSKVPAIKTTKLKSPSVDNLSFYCFLHRLHTDRRRGMSLASSGILISLVVTEALCGATEGSSPRVSSEGVFCPLAKERFG